MAKKAHGLEGLRNDVIDRWKAAFERIEEVKAKVPGAVDTVYSPYPAFALENYSTQKFKPGVRLARSPSRDLDDRIYQLDALGRPLHVRYRHSVNRIDWQGIYRYGADEVEHIEFCMQSGVPSLYNRLILDGACTLVEQRFVCNGGGYDPSYARMPVAKKIKAILADGYNYFIYITRYHVEDGVVRSAEEMHEVAGEIQKPTREYTYGADGTLQRIVQHWPGAGIRTLFVAKGTTGGSKGNGKAKPKASLKELSERLSAKLAKAIVARLKKASFPAPLVALELSYREGQHHIPQLVPLTERDQVDGLTLAAEINSKRWITLSEEDFVPEITHFNAEVETTQNEAAVGKMLRAAARQVTEAAPKKLVAPGFVAFAIDWELEGDELGKILKQCGAGADKLREWKKKGWL